MRYLRHIVTMFPLLPPLSPYRELIINYSN
nr:MAG TPA: hypothetical protein [Caudoviricetes sp.]